MDDRDPSFSPSPALAETRVAILGLGLMGGSLALALRGRCKALLAYDPDPNTVQLARQFHLVDTMASDLAEVLPSADLIILAAPVGAIFDLIHSLKSYSLSETPAKPRVVLDIGSTKTEIMQALDTLPAAYDPVGGHPMCGKETSGLGSADRGLFREATFVFVSLPRTSTSACDLVEQLARAVGAHPLWLDPRTHDHWVAATSHLPYLLAVALALATPEETRPLIGPGFRSASRLAGSHPRMMLDILETNRKPILQALNRYKMALSALEERLLSEGTRPLISTLTQARTRRERLLA